MPEQVNGGGVLALDCLGRTPAGLETDAHPELQFADPFVVYAEDHCSTLGWQERDYEGRARRQLEATQSFRAAAELERGALSNAADLDNRWLSQNPTIVGAPNSQSSVGALADVEMGLAEMFAGRQSMVHVSPAILTVLVAAQALQLQGQKWMTAMGNVVVADAGYKGQPPDGGGMGEQYIYGTAMIQYRLSPIMLVPGTLEQARAHATDLATNLTTVYAERLVLFEFDPGVVAAQTDIPVYVHGTS
jgi:hypothetical protein